MTNCPFASIDEFDDLNTIDQYYRALKAGCDEKKALKFVNDRSRDNSRTPYPWSSKKNGGFTEGTPWLKMNPDYRENNAQRQQKEEGSTFKFYQRLIRLRKEKADILVYGTIEEIQVENGPVIAFSRKTESGKTISIYINLGEEEEKLPAEDGKCLSCNYGDMIFKENTLILRPYEAVMMEKTQD